jgi:hypothetical protein
MHSEVQIYADIYRFLSLSIFWVPCILFRILRSRFLDQYSSLNVKEQVSNPLKRQAKLRPNTLNHYNAAVILSVISFAFKTPKFCLCFLFISSV